MISNRHLFSKSFSLLKKDPIILAPYIFFFIVVNIISTSFPDQITKEHTFRLLALFLGSSIFEVMMKTAVYIAGRLRLNNKDFSPGTVLHSLSTHFMTLVIANTLLLLPFLALIYQMYTGSESTQSVMSILIIIPSLLFLFLSDFIPLEIISNNSKALDSIRVSLRFMKNHFRIVLRFLLFNWMIRVIAFFFTAFFIGIPIVGESLFQAIIQGFGYTLCALMYVHFYREMPSSE